MIDAETIARIEANKLATRYMLAAVLVALGERSAIDAELALRSVETMAMALQNPFGVTEASALRAMALAAEEMLQLRPTMVRLTSLPPGAGRA